MSLSRFCIFDCYSLCPCFVLCFVFFFFFKQKTAYEMRISDWSSDVCSSDLTDPYLLIQYSPTTKQVFTVPLVIFPPWINRFYKIGRASCRERVCQYV